jgi:NAD+ synthase (glutamine-hydrolysing)
MEYGFVRVGAVVPRLKVANCNYNENIIKNIIYEANKKNIQILSFPELSLTGYTCADLFHQDMLIKSALSSLKNILKSTQKINMVVILGMPVRHKNALYNCSVVVEKGNVLGIVPKVYIPNYKEFYENRWFISGENIKNEFINLFDKKIPFGTDLLFTDKNYSNLCFGTEICEDLWMPIPPSSVQSINGSVLTFNLSASNEIIGKYDYRKQLIIQQSARCLSGYIYTSAGIDESTTDVVFSGHALISENGTVLNESERFKRENQLIYSELDIEKLINERNKMVSYSSVKMDSNVKYIEFSLNEKNYKDFNRYIDPHPFVPGNDFKRDKRCEEIFNIQIAGLAKRYEHTGLKKAVIGISGGLDSTLAILVVAKVFDELKISRENIIAVTMPGFGTSNITYNNAIKLIEYMGASLKEIDIKDACLMHFKDIGHEENIHDVTYENVQARERTQILMDLANKIGAFVIGTGDLSELALGWCTYNGDHMSMYAVNSGVPKTLVKYLVKWVADNVFEKSTSKVLIDILNTPISPELLPTNKNGEIKQKTEDIIGPYELHDFFLYQFLRFGFTPKKILFLAQKAYQNEYSGDEIRNWLKVFYKRFFSQQFKRSCLPDGPKVGSVSLSPRGDWRMPSDADNEVWLKELFEN